MGKPKAWFFSGTHDGLRVSIRVTDLNEFCGASHVYAEVEQENGQWAQVCLPRAEVILDDVERER